jgi:hypothetical protein
MKFHLSENVTESDADSYSQETAVASSIIKDGLVVVFLVTVMVVGVMLACTAFWKQEAKTERHPTGQMELSVNSTTSDTLYVVQSAYLEVTP